MVYKRNTYKKRSTVKRNWYNKKRSYSLQGIAKQVAALKGIINSEKKYHDEAEASAVSTSGELQGLHNIAQGDQNYQRNGNSFLCKSIQVKGHITWNATGTTQVVKLWLVQDNQQIADTEPVFGDIFETSTFNDVNATLEKKNIGRFKILWSQMYTQNQQIDQVQVNHYLSMNHHIRYNGNAAADIQKGGLYLVKVSNQPTNTPTVSAATRLSFYDN